MKKALMIGGVVFGCGGAFLAALVVLVNVRGGLGPQHSELASMPLIGGMLKTQPAPPPPPDVPQQSATSALRSGRDVPFLRFGAQARLGRLADELEVKRSDYEAMLRRLERRERELEAWERQLKEERDALRERFGAEKEELARTREELARRAAELDSQQIAIEQAEEKNLKATAEIYAKMSPEKAAAFLAEIYAGGEPETVAKIVYLMDARAAAKALEAFVDPKISAEITEKLKSITQGAAQGG